VHDALQHSVAVEHDAPGSRQQTGESAHVTPLHVAPDPAQQPAVPQSAPACPQHVPPSQV
jgi:hypothetical protein